MLYSIAKDASAYFTSLTVTILTFGCRMEKHNYYRNFCSLARTFYIIVRTIACFYATIERHILLISIFCRNYTGDARLDQTKVLNKLKELNFKLFLY